MVDDAHRLRRRGHRGRHPPAAGRRPTSSGSSRSPRTASGSPRSGRSRRDAVGLPDAPDEIYASMGNYVFTTDALIDAVSRDAERPAQQARHGRQHHPAAGRAGRGQRLRLPRQRGARAATDRDRGYWRDVGTLDSFYEAHMDLIAIHPIFNLYNHDWPIYTEYRPWPPAKFVHGWQERLGRAIGSMVSPGAVISGSLVENSVVSPERARALVGARGRLGADGGRRHRPARGGPQRDPRQERRSSRRAPRSASTWSATVSGSPSPTAASWSSARARS